MFWLASRSKLVSNIAGAVLLKSVGNSSTLKLQHSYLANSIVDSVLSHACSHSNELVSSHNFREYYGNDETVFEAPGYGIPSVTLTRYPFPEYHTHLDTPDLISEESLESTYNILLDSINILETCLKPISVLPGLLASPIPNTIYIYSASPGIDKKVIENENAGIVDELFTNGPSSKLDTFQIMEKYCFT